MTAGVLCCAASGFTHWGSHGLNLLLHLHLGGLGNSGHLDLLLRGRGNCALGDGDNSLSTLGDCEGACEGENKIDKQAAAAGSMPDTCCLSHSVPRCCCDGCSAVHRCLLDPPVPRAARGGAGSRQGCSKRSSGPDKSTVRCTLLLSCPRLDGNPSARPAVAGADAWLVLGVCHLLRLKRLVICKNKPILSPGTHQWPGLRPGGPAGPEWRTEHALFLRRQQ